MSVQIIIKDKEGLNFHGQTLLYISQSYEAAVSQAYTKFDVTVNGNNQQGKVIEAFIEKLNTLQKQIFEKYPKLLAKYGQILTDYVVNLEAAGFSSQEISSTSYGIESVMTTLIGDQYDIMSEVKSSLEPALNQAASVLGVAPISLTSILTSGYDDLEACKANRSSTHEALVSAQATFVKELTSLRAELEPMANVLANARYIGSLPASRVIELVQGNYLTLETIDHLDKLQDAGDLEVLEVLLTYANAKDKLFEELGHLDATHISQPMMDMVYEKFYTEIVTLDIDNLDNQKQVKLFLQKFLDGLSQQSLENVKIYTEKLAASGDRMAAQLSDKAIKLIPEFPKTVIGMASYELALETVKSQGTLPIIARELKCAGILSAFFESLSVQEIGESYKNISTRARGLTRKTILEDSLEIVFEVFNHENADKTRVINEISYKTDLKLLPRGEKTVPKEERTLEKATITVTLTGESDTVELEETKKYRKELLVKRQERMKDLLLDIAIVALPKGYTEVFDSAIDIFSNTSLMHQRLDGVDDIANESLGENYSEKFSKGLKGVSVLSQFIGDLSSIEAELLEIDDDAKAKIFNIGGYIVTSTANTPPGYHRFSSTYDLQSILQLHELQTSGLRPYIYRANGGDYRVVEAFDKAIASYDIKEPESFWSVFGVEPEYQGDTTVLPVLTKETKALLAGQGGSFSETSIVETHEGMVWLKPYLSKDMKIEINDPNIRPIYSDEHYREHSQEYFEGLVKP